MNFFKSGSQKPIRQKMTSFIPYGTQDIDSSDISAVVKVLKSSNLTQGEQCDLFEKEICDYTGANFSCAVNSATSALHIACLALGIDNSSLVWTSPITFVASANAAKMCGAEIDFVDINENLNICPEKLAEKLIAAKRLGKLPKAIIVVHMCGQAAEMKRISELTRQFDIKIIEDASHAIGAEYDGQKVGSCKYSDLTVFSFHPVKIITTGEGGVVTTNSNLLHEKLCLLRSHGVTREKRLLNNKKQPDWYYEQILLGYNYRMTDIQAALGISQMRKLDGYVKRRHEIATLYDESESKLPGTPIPQAQYSSYHLYVLRINSEKSINKRDHIFKDLRSRGIGVNLHYYPVHLQPYYRKLGFKPGDFPAAELYAQEGLSLPIFPTLTNEEHEKVIQALERHVIKV